MSAPVMVELSAEDRLRAWERSCPAWVVSITGIIATAYDADTKIKVFGRTADEVARRWQSQSTTSAVPSVLSAHGVCGVLGRDWTRTVSADLRNPGTSADPRNAAALPNTPRPKMPWLVVTASTAGDLVQRLGGLAEAAQ